jgi:AraC-like DNA-binding protein
MEYSDYIWNFPKYIDKIHYRFYNIFGDVMFNNMENLKLIDILCRPASRYKEFKCRPNHGMVFKISGESIYTFDDREIIHHAGELLFIPKGEKYTVRCESSESRYLLINFDAKIENPTCTIFDISGFPELDFVYDSLEKIWLFGEESGRLKCISVFYDVLSFVNRKHRSDYASKKNFSKIKPALEYLEENIFDSNLRAGELSRMCNISDTYFRKIFKSHYGLNPAEYINNKRLSRAHSIIASGEFDKLSEVAYLCGYDDPLYFSKLFKAKYKLSPSLYCSIDLR